jgi:hypothetical protein
VTDASPQLQVGGSCAGRYPVGTRVRRQARCLQRRGHRNLVTSSDLPALGEAFNAEPASYLAADPDSSIANLADDSRSHISSGRAAGCAGTRGHVSEYGAESGGSEDQSGPAQHSSASFSTWHYSLASPPSADAITDQLCY